MQNIYLRFLIVSIGSSTLALFAIKYYMARYQFECKIKSMDLLIGVAFASSACGFVGIMLIDGTRFDKSVILYWLFPIVIGSVFGVIGTLQILLSSKPNK